ncbi:Uncharacterised protein [uncultured archaeon]|nr:Uncharacterised protein [uncultured archaeon]
MKRDILVILVFLILFFLPLISAVEFTMNDTFKQGETILAKVSGNFITPIAKQNVVFYRGHVQIPIQYDVANLGGDYYIYAITTGKNAEDDYSISIENVQYMKGADIVNNNIVKNFTITNETADFSANPGFFSAENNFVIKVQNLLDNKITINVNAENPTRQIFISPENIKQTSFSIESGDIKEINFNIGAGQSGVQTIELRSGNFTYKIPVYVYSPENTTISEGLRLEPSEFTTSIQSNFTSTRTFYLYNDGTTEIKNISLSLSNSFDSSAQLSQTTITSLAAGAHVSVDISFLSSSENELSGNLKATSDNFSTSSFIDIKFLGNYSSVNDTTPVTSKTCAQLNGIICSDATEKCDSTPIYAKDSVCCLTTCTKIPKSSAGTIIAIIILLLIALLVVWFYFKKYKKAKKPVDLLKVAQGKKIIKP